MNLKAFPIITELVKVQLSPETVESLEGITGKKITRNGDQIIREVAEMAENTESNNSIEMSVCNNTKKEMETDG